MTAEFDLELADGRMLHAYDTGGDGTPVFWHHGTPNTGAPPVPLMRPGVRWISHDRPGYGGSTPLPGRDIASAAADVAAVADELGITRFAVMGHSGGGPHALACAALLPDRVTAVAAIASLAPWGAEGLDWFAGMAPSSEASLRAASQGRAAKEAHEAAEEEGQEEESERPHTASAVADPAAGTADATADVADAGASNGDSAFTPADEAMFAGPWSWLLDVVRPAMAAGPAALIDDDLAYVAPWGFDPAQVSAPLLLLHGDADRMVPSSHSKWLAAHLPHAELWTRPGDGHISILTSAGAALDWLLQPRAS
jgi:pimeloyl-ACP methyl ester carboxylesterase